MRGCSLAVALLIAGCSGESFEIANEPVAGDTGSAIVVADGDAPEDSSASADSGEADADASSDADADADADPSADASADAAASADANATADTAARCDTTVVCFPDRDEDGFAPAAAVGAVACECAKGTTTRSPTVTVDCNDEDPRVFPGATTFYTDPYCVPGTACAVKSFDYNCSGAEEKQFGGFSACASGCVGTGYASPPGCGGTATLTQCKTELVCKTVTYPWKQGCR